MTVTIQLPSRMADRLLDHVSHCLSCRLHSHCQVGKVLIQKTLKERHG